jgi:8-oxo-dGTP pyrophosphatase MutT (NUDIX family)
MRKVYYQAAGGVVFHAGRVLLLDRPGRNEVRLPKGHVKEGESITAAALREVREETGYAHLALVADLGQQRVKFVDPYRQRRVKRDEWYFLMFLEDDTQTERTESEHQFSPIWIHVDDAIARLTFQTEQEFVRRALLWLEANVKSLGPFTSHIE